MERFGSLLSSYMVPGCSNKTHNSHLLNPFLVWSILYSPYCLIYFKDLFVPFRAPLSNRQSMFCWPALSLVLTNILSNVGILLILQKPRLLSAGQIKALWLFSLFHLFFEFKIQKQIAACIQKAEVGNYWDNIHYISKNVLCITLKYILWLTHNSQVLFSKPMQQVPVIHGARVTCRLHRLKTVDWWGSRCYFLKIGMVFISVTQDNNKHIWVLYNASQCLWSSWAYIHGPWPLSGQASVSSFHER
jgi:hypothetical protein